MLEALRVMLQKKGKFFFFSASIYEMYSRFRVMSSRYLRCKSSLGIHYTGQYGNFVSISALANGNLLHGRFRECELAIFKRFIRFNNGKNLLRKRSKVKKKVYLYAIPVCYNFLVEIFFTRFCH